MAEREEEPSVEVDVLPEEPVGRVRAAAITGRTASAYVVSRTYQAATGPPPKTGTSAWSAGVRRDARELARVAPTLGRVARALEVDPLRRGLDWLIRGDAGMPEASAPLKDRTP